MKFATRLRQVLNAFDYEQAIALSDEIHEAECNGYKISLYEDRLWEQLTMAILQYPESA